LNRENEVTEPDARQLTLIGTVHRDCAGEKRLTELLEELAPDLITLEMSQAAFDYRQMYARPLLLRLERILDQLAEAGEETKERLASHPRIIGIYELLAFPFEYRAAETFAAPRGIPVQMIDLSSVSLTKLRRVERGLITKRNIKTLLNLPVEEGPAIPENYNCANSLLACEAPEALRWAFLRGRRGEEGIGPRDAAMADAIGRLLAQNPGHLAHIGGWVHLVEDPQGETLRSRLAAANPTCRLLAPTTEPLRAAPPAADG